MSSPSASWNWFRVLAMTVPMGLVTACSGDGSLSGPPDCSQFFSLTSTDVAVTIGAGGCYEQKWTAKVFQTGCDFRNQTGPDLSGTIDSARGVTITAKTPDGCMFSGWGEIAGSAINGFVHVAFGCACGPQETTFTFTIAK
jgi:outer membrane lipoprotein SlyB